MKKLLLNVCLYKISIDIKRVLIVLFLCSSVFALTSCVDPKVEDTKLVTPQNVMIAGSIVSWDAVVNSTNYAVHISGLDGSPVSTRELSYDLETLSLEHGGTYSVQIQAIGNIVKYQHSDLSLSVSYLKPDLVELSKPTNLKKTQIGFSWDVVEGASSYVVTINGLSTSPYTVTTNSLGIEENKFVRGTEYKVTIVAKPTNTDVNKDSKASGELIYVRPSLPKISKVVNISKDDTGFTWDIVANAVGYIVSIEGITGSPFTVTDNKLVIEQSLFVRGTVYEVKVQAKGNDVEYSNSDLSDPFSYTRPTLPKLATPQNLVKEGWLISWDVVENSVGYLIYIEGVTGSPFSVTTTEYDLSNIELTAGNHNITVVAVGDDIVYDNSLATEAVSLDVLPRLPRPINGGAVSKLPNGNFHIGIGVYQEGTAANYANKLGVLIKNSINNEVVKYQEIDAAFGTGSAYEFNGLLAGRYVITFKAIGNHTTHGDSLYYTPEIPFIIKGELSESILTVKEGVLTWTEVVGATSYKLYINDVLQEVADKPFDLPTEPGVYNIKLIVSGETEVYTDSETTVVYTVYDENAAPLDKPQITLTNNLISWLEVLNAISYKIIIGEIEKTSNTLSFDLSTVSNLSPGTLYEVKVIAIGNGIDYANSEASDIVEYTTPLPKLGTPVHGFNVDTNIFHIGIGPYSIGEAEDFGGKFGVLIVDTTTLEEWTDEFAAGFNAGSSYIFAHLNLPAGNYTITYRAIGNGTTRSNSNYYAPAVAFTVALKEIDKPVLTITDNEVSWTEVLNASSYELYINDGLQVDATSPFGLSNITEAGTYVIKVIANGEEGYKDSEETINYVVSSDVKTQLNTPSNLVITDSILTFDIVINASGYRIYVDNELKATINTSSYDLSLLVLDLGTYNVQVLAFGDQALYLDSEKSVATEYAADQVLIKLNPITRADFAGTPEKGHGGGHYNFLPHSGHAVYNQEGFSRKLRFELVLKDNSVVTQDFDLGEVWLNKPVPEPWLFDAITENGNYEMRVILLATQGSGYANSDPIVLTVTWPSA
jgi:hypothetical protein